MAAVMLAYVELTDEPVPLRPIGIHRRRSAGAVAVPREPAAPAVQPPEVTAGPIVPSASHWLLGL